MEDETINTSSQSRIPQETSENHIINLNLTTTSISTLNHEQRHAEVPSFSIDQEILTNLVADNSFTTLHQAGRIHGIAAALETNLDSGISGQEEDLRRRREAFGSNLNVEVNNSLLTKKGNFHRLVVDAIKDTTVILLLCCATLSLVLGIKRNGFEEGILDGVFVFLVISSVVSLSITIKFFKNQRNEKLSRKRKAVKVLRDGRLKEVAFSEVVVGDIVCLQPDDKVPADGLFVQGKGLKLDDADDDEQDDSLNYCFHRYEFPYMFRDAKVLSGECCMLVTAVGEHTETSKMMKLSKGNHQKKESKLQMAVDKMNSRLERICLSLSLLVLAVQVLRCFTWETKCGDQSHDPDPKGVKNTIQEIMTASTKIIKKQGLSLNRYTEMLSILVLVIRDGLPLGLLVSLAYASKKFKCYGAIARNLPVCASIGLVTTICSGRTSDLSLDHAKMVDLWIGMDRVEKPVMGIKVAVLNALREAIAITSSEFSDDGLLFWAKKVLGVDREKMKGSCSIEACDIDNNRAGFLLKWRGEGKNSVNMNWEGDPEIILSMCTHYFDRHGTLQTLDEHKRDMFKKIIKDITADTLQCTAFARKQVEEEAEEVELRDGGLTWLGIVSLKNPYASEVKQAVEECGESGVKTKLLLEDDIETSRLIALNSGIIKPEEDAKEAVMEASEFRNSSHEARLLMVDKIRVMANASPLDKLLMVQCLKQKGEVVAVTGTSTRDSPSLKAADVGVALGERRSSQLAKEHSDIVILDKKFETIVNILKLGRCVCYDIRKFIQLQLTLNMAAFTINLVAAAIFSSEVPLQPFQLLWVNLIMGVLGALALAAPISLPPPPPAPAAISPVTTKTMWRNIIVQVLYQVSVLLAIQFKGKDVLRSNQKIIKHIVFNSFVLCQVFVLIIARDIRNPNIFGGNKRSQQKYRWFLVILGSIVILDIAIIEIVTVVGRGKRLNLRNWCVCIGVAVMSLPIGLVAKLISWPK